ncbi:hypothetical protein D3C76_1438800 [compost metagenome]
MPLHFFFFGLGGGGNTGLGVVSPITSLALYGLKVVASLWVLLTTLGMRMLSPTTSVLAGSMPLASAIRYHIFESPQTAWAMLARVSPWLTT